MSNYGIAVDTGGAAPRAMGDMDITAFWRNAFYGMHGIRIVHLSHEL